MVCYLW